MIYQARSSNPLLTLALFLAVSPVWAQPVDGDEDVIVDEEVIGEDEVVGDEEDVVADEEVVSEGESSSEEEIVSDEDVIADEEAVFDDAAPDEVAQSGAAVEEGLWEAGEEPYRQPPAGKGVLWGRLVDTERGEPVLEGSVKVKGRSEEGFVDFDGYYRLELPPGTYTLELFVPLHEQETLGNVLVTGGAVSRVDAQLKPQEGAVQTDVIEDEAETQTVEGLALARQRSASQGDAIGRDEISKGTDSNAAEAAQRVVGANIVGGRFVYVRGLGERYSNSLLGGYPLPSPEPDRAAVPLDVFPASVLDSLTIVKTFTPDMPGDFAGGSVQIETRSVPSEPLFQVNLTGGVNTQSTFQQRLDYPGSKTDWLGFDSGKRSLPGSVPDNQRVVSNAVDPGSELSPNDTTAIGKDVNRRMNALRNGTPLNHGMSVVAGNTWKFAEKQQLGVLASLNYSHKYEVYEDMVVKDYWVVGDDPRGFSERVDYRVDRGVEQIRWGTFGKVSYLPSADHKITLTALHSQLADDTTSQYSGLSVQNAANYNATQLSWVERGMTFGVLSGRHSFKPLNRAEFGWDVSASGASRTEPDRRDTVYQKSNSLRVDPSVRGSDREPGWFYFNGDESGRHFWAEQSETSVGGKIDWKQPLMAEAKQEQLDLKAGGLINVKNRQFSARRLIMRPSKSPLSDTTYYCLGESYSMDCPEKLFQDDNIPGLIHLEENPQPGDAYDAALNVYAGYAMLDWTPNSRVRIAAGTRVEWTEQSVDPKDPLNAQQAVAGAEVKSVDPLPAISLILSGTPKMKTRFSYARTLARPQVREIAPFGFSDYFGGRVVSGNPDLKITDIDNVDARVEFYPSLTEVLAFSTFFKHLRNPIEQILIPADTAPQVTYENADQAHVIGVELEARKNLGFIADVLDVFSINTNLTLTHSRTEVRQTGNNTITNPSRPLINQAPWVINAALDYENAFGTTARLAYNVNAPTLVEVGTDGVPDAYAQPFHSLDLSFAQQFLEHWKASLTLENLINDDVLVTQGNEVNRVDGELDLSNVTRRYTKGRTISLTIGYTL